jgi:hypothetical protein
LQLSRALFLSLRTPLAPILAAVAFAVAVPADGAIARTHRYSVSIDSGLSMLAVRACFAGVPPESLIAESLDASLALIDAQIEGSRKRVVPSGALPLKDVPADGCLLYRVDVSHPVNRHDRSGEKLRHVGRDLLLSAGLWLWRPETLAEEEEIELSFDLPEGMHVSAPWQPVEDAPSPTFRLGRTPYDWPATIALGRFDERDLQIDSSRLRTAVLDGSPAVDPEQMYAWIEDAARIVTLAYGHFPVSALQVVIVPNAGGSEPTPWAYVIRGGNPAVHFFVNQRRPLAEFYDDWTATHELSHLFLPFVNYEDAWLSEGIATYYQTVLRARAGRLSESDAWSRLHAGFRSGRTSAPGLTLAQATEGMYHGGTFMRVYWQGAAMLFLADVRLRQRSRGEQSLDTALAALQACCLVWPRAWSAKEVLAKLDELTGDSVFGEILQAYVSSRDFPDLSEAYQLLGLSPGGEMLELAPTAAQRALREAIMRSGATRHAAHSWERRDD